MVMKRSIWIASIVSLLSGSVITIGAQQTYSLFELNKYEAIPFKKPSSAQVDISFDPSLGSPNAPITIVEFSDFECPYCKLFHDKTFPKIKSRFIDRDLVRFVHKDLPLPHHENAYLAAKAARCSQNKDDYWNAYHALYDQQDCLKCKGPVNIAKKALVKPGGLEQCLRQSKVDQAININISEAQLNDIRSTPTFIIGTTNKDFHKGRLIVGALPWNKYKEIIEQELDKAREAKSKHLND